MTGWGFDYKYVRSGLLRLCDEASSRGFKWQEDHVHTLIRVGEYSLALDDLAAAYLENTKQISNDILNVFDDLAARMGIVAGDEWEAVAELRALPRQP